MSDTPEVTPPATLPLPLSFEPGLLIRAGGHITPLVASTLRANPGDNRIHILYQPGDHHE